MKEKEGESFEKEHLGYHSCWLNQIKPDLDRKSRFGEKDLCGAIFLFWSKCLNQTDAQIFTTYNEPNTENNCLSCQNRLWVFS